MDPVSDQRIRAGSADKPCTPSHPEVYAADALVAGVGGARILGGGAFQPVPYIARGTVTALGFSRHIVAAHIPQQNNLDNYYFLHLTLRELCKDHKTYFSVPYIF